MKVIAYTYEADIHCIDCTRKRYESGGFNGIYDSLDNEGNLIHPLFDTDEWQELDESFIAENPIQYLACGDCHEVIEEYVNE
jgi:hypothetical protein